MISYIPTYVSYTVLGVKIRYEVTSLYSINVCDRACKNRPCECKKSPILACLLYHNFITVYTTATKSLSLLQNLMGFLLQLMEMR